MDRDYEVKVKEIMYLKQFQGARFVAGYKEGKERIIKKVNVLEVPDIKDWKLEDELLLTQGFSLKNEKERREILLAIIEKGAAGLAIKLKRYLEKIPEDMIQLANELQFPLIELPFELTFSEIITAVMNMINSRQTMIHEYNNKIHKELMNIVLGGGGIEVICKKISDSINNTVILEDKYGKLMAYSIKVNFEEEVETINEILANKYFENEEEPTKVKPELQRQTVYREITIPINTDVEFFGYMCVLQTVKPFSGFDIITVENATQIIAFAIMKKKTIEAIEKRHLNEFLDMLLSNEIEEVLETIHQGKSYNLDLSKKHCVVSIQYNEPNNEKQTFLENKEEVQRGNNKLYKIAKFILSIQGFKGVVGNKGDNIIILLETEEYSNISLFKKNLNRLAEKILEKVEKDLDTSKIVFAISRSYPGTNASKAYQEVKKVLIINENNHFMKKNIVYFQDLGVFKLLHHTPRKELDSFLAEYIEPLIQYDQENGADLANTLEAYFMHNCNIKNTAKYIYVHYNTIIYRLQKVKEILGSNLEDWDEQLNLQIALKLRKANINKKININGS